MEWSDVVGKRLALILVADESDDPPGGILRGVVRAKSGGFMLERDAANAPFPLMREWGNRVKLLSEASAPEVLAILGDVDCFVTLSVGPLPEEVNAKDITATGLNWKDFSEDTPGGGEA